MKKLNRMFAGALGVLGLSFSLAVHPVWSGSDSENERLVTLLATNDIHGWVEPRPQNDGSKRGGFAWWSGVIKAIRDGLQTRYGDRAGVLVLDSGDQFQGTLISNYTEGKLVFDLMSQMGYDAVVPGNHDYDFGPKGWLDDLVVEGRTEDNPRGVIERLAKDASFPLLSANTYLRNSLVDDRGNPVEPNESGRNVNWEKAKRPSFLKPYTLKTVADIRVALIGLDNVATPKITVPENVSDLYFRDPISTYLEVRAELSGKADAFVIMIHDGDAMNDTHATDMLKDLIKAGKDTFKDGARLVDAVLAGHTHMINRTEVSEVPLIQSGWGMDRFGRVDLVFEKRGKDVTFKRMKSYAGAALFFEACDKHVKSFCETEDQVPHYEMQKAVPDEAVQKVIKAAEKDIEPLAKRLLGEAKTAMTRDRVKESPLVNVLTDEMREMAKADIAFINTGGVRDNISAGEIYYEDLFRVFPFSNHGVKIGPMTFNKIMKLLVRAAQSCGGHSVLMQSGLKVHFASDCTGRNEDRSDQDAKILKVETAAGDVLYDVETGGYKIDEKKGFMVATLDFLVAGGSGYDGFKGVDLVQDYGVLREAMTEKFLKSPVLWTSEGMESRWIRSERK